SIGWGAFAYVGADLHLRFGLTFGAIGLIVGTFGIGGLLYAASVQQLVNRFGQAGLAIFGGGPLGLAYVTLARRRALVLTASAVTAIGLGFYALHNTLQTNATQMTPQARAPRSRSSLRRSISARPWGSPRARSCSIASRRCRCSSRPPSRCRHSPGGLRKNCDATPRTAARRRAPAGRGPPRAPRRVASNPAAGH